MWGNDWGTMIWGSSVAVPTFGPVGWAILLGAFLGATAVIYRRPLSKVATPLALLSVVLLPLVAIALTLPHTFVNGTIADADEVNANFAAVVACPAGMSRINGVCISPLQFAADMTNAISHCRSSFQSYVCTHREVHIVCASGTNPMAGAPSGWLGDHGLAPGGNFDGEYLTWNNGSCSADLDGPPDHGSLGTHPFLCCQ
jgi:hypothetical protein